MRVITSLSCSSLTPYFLAYAGARRLNIAGAVSGARVPSSFVREPGRPEYPESFSFSPAIAEVRAAHSDDRHAVANPVARHARLPFEDVVVRRGSILPARIGRCRSVANRPRLPEIVVDAARGVELAERHLHAVTDLHGLGIDVGHLALEAAATLEVDDRRDDRWRQR